MENDLAIRWQSIHKIVQTQEPSTALSLYAFYCGRALQQENIFIRCPVSEDGQNTKGQKNLKKFRVD